MYAADTAEFDFTSKWSSNSSTVSGITVTFGGNTSNQTGFRRIKKGSTVSFSAESGKTITGITITYRTIEKTTPTSGQITSSPTGINTNATSWNGSASSVVFTDDATNGGEFDISGITVTYETASDASLTISIEDLYLKHNVYNPSREVGGFTITTSGWQSYNPSGNYYLTLSKTGGDNSIVITPNSANSSVKIKQVVLVGVGTTPFANSAASSDNTYNTTGQDQIIWRNEGGASSATITITATDRPSISAIWITTDQETTWSKQDVSLVFSPNSSSVSTNSTSVTVAPVTTPSNFRVEYTFDAGGTGSNGSYHQTYENYEIIPGSTAGSTTVTASAVASTFFNAPTSAIYTLNISETVKSTAITVDDMKYSKTMNENGLSANNDLNRTLGGFNFAFTGGQGVKYNNEDGLLIRNDGSAGKLVITPQKSGTGDITITRVDLTTYAGYTGSVSVNGRSATTINGVSSYSFDELTDETFTLEAVSGQVYITGFVVYYTDASNVLNTEKITPTITFNKTSESISSSDTYTSPTVTTVPANFDIGIVSDNTSVATVASDNRLTPPLVSLQGEEGTAIITASSVGNDFYNAAASVTYTVTVTSTSSKKWDFTTLDVKNTITNDTGWHDTETDTDVSGWTKNGDYYKNVFTTSDKNSYAAYNPAATSQLYELKFARDNSGGLGGGAIRLYPNTSGNTDGYMTFNNSTVVIAVPANAGQSVLVTFDGGNGDTEAGFSFTNATLESNESATEFNSNSMQKTVTLTATATGYVTLKVNKSKVKLYKIEVKDETRKTLSFRDTSNNYERNVGTGTTSSTDNHFNHRVMFTPSDGSANALTYANDKGYLTIESSDPLVLDVSNAYIAEGNFGNSSSFYFNNIVPKGAGTATLTVTFAGNNNYKPTSYTSQVYTVYGPTALFQVKAEDQEIQRGQFSVISPVITDRNSNAVGIKLMEDGSGRYTTYVLGEDEDEPDYSTYFDFTFETGVGSGTNYDQIQVNSTTGQVTTETGSIAAEPGATRQVTITAKPKKEYESAFTSTDAVTTSITLTIIEKTADVQLDFYWDEACTKPISTTEYEEDANKLKIFDKGIFANGFPNGRMIYAKVKNEGDSIWFSYAQNASAETIPANPKVDKKKRVFACRRGVPIYIDDDFTDDFTNGSPYVTLNIVATTWDATTQKRRLNGSVARMKFIIVNHDRPDQPTYDPISPDATATLNKDGRKIMNTAQNVVAYGEGASKGVEGVNNIVYGKFSTESVYTTEQLINEENVQRGKDNVPVVSTEVAKRRFTSVQIKPYTDTYEYGEYISEQTYTEYWYLYDTELTLYKDSETQLSSTYRYNINISGSTEPTSEAAPSTNLVTWYNKITKKRQEVDSYDGKITYAITERNGASDAAISSDGTVTAGSNTGWVKVTVTYSGGEQHGGVDGEPKYVSTTDKSTASYYVYIYDPDKETPVITPATRKFSGTLTYEVQAPENWKARYTTDGTDPDYTIGTELAATASFIETIGSSMSVGDKKTIKAIAYNEDKTSKSVIVSETYTKVAAIPDPIFDPDGTETPYKYNTNTLTVQIACPYAGSVIYYTTDGSDPVIGASNTSMYSGLSKVVISGDVTIKAVAYDPENDIYSNVVPSAYKYSDTMLQPYFQISNDGGKKWYGYPQTGEELTENGAEWYSGQSLTIMPSTQIRIVDPNPVKGTTYCTVVDGVTPGDNESSFRYDEGYPFTLGKTTTGKAIVILEDASSAVSSARFIIESSRYYVWEALEETTPTGKMQKKDGFIISTDEDLLSRNTGTKVNKNSLAAYNVSSTTYAQEHITATFGGYDLNDWEEMTIADASIGVPLDNVGDYSIKSKENAKDETTKNYNHINSLDTYQPTTHEKTFTVPAYGTFVRFEPERDGDLTIWALQQGALNYDDDTYLCDKFIRCRPVYFVDEQGKSYKVKEVNGVPQLWSSARLSENWRLIQATAATKAWTPWEGYQTITIAGGATKDVQNKGYSVNESDSLYTYMYKRYLDTYHISPGDPIKPFAIHIGENLTWHNGKDLDNSIDGTGYVLATGGYVKYTFEVKAGKTYYFMGQGTKVGIRGFQFVPSESDSDVDSRAQMTINADTEEEQDYITGNLNTTSPIDVTLKRAFAANKWAALVLPFSVSSKQLEEKFSDGTNGVDVIHFDDITNEGKNIHLVRHWYKMLVAGTPVLIRPTKDIDADTGVTFEGVRIETNAIDKITGSDDSYTMTGTYQYDADGLNQYDYYVNTNGNFAQLKSEAHAAIKATRAWLRPKNPSEAKTLTIDFSDFNGEGSTLTGIMDIETGDIRDGRTRKMDGKVYNLSGQIVRTDGSLKNLPKGVYIMNGKRFVVE